MATDDQQVLVTGVASAPATFRIPGNGQITPRAIFAHYDGSSAAGTYVPALKITSDGGELVGIYPLRSTTLAAGVSADMSWFPEVDDAPFPVNEVVGITSETVFYDTVNANTPLVMSTTLATGTEYVVIIEGTYTVWNSVLGTGTPEANAQVPGAAGGRVSTEVGLDADTAFAVKTGGGQSLGHSSLVQLSLDGGGTYTHVEPVGGPYATPLTGHLYRYNLTGQGFPLRIRILDINPPDNYGKLRITLQIPNGTGTGSGAGSLVPPADTTLNGDVLTVSSGLPTWAAPAAGGVASVTAADTSIVVGGTAANPTVRTGTLDVIAADHPPAADWSNNSHKITSVTDPTLAQDAATKNYVDTTAGSPLTTKGDIYGHSTVNARIPVGSDGQVLTANSATGLGVSWAAIPSPGGSGTWQVATTVGGLTTGNGNAGFLRTGSSPFDFLPVIYDSTYGHWVSEVFMGLTADATGGNTASNTYVGTASSFQHGPAWPQGNYINAGLTLQLRVLALGFTNGTATGSLSATITGYNIGGADSVTLAAGTVVATTTAAARVGIDSGWVSVTPSSTTDLMHFGLSWKTTAATFSVLLPGVLFRWIG